MNETEEKPVKKRAAWDNKKFVFPGRLLLKYLLITGLSLIFWELIMAYVTGGIKPSSLFFLFFIPAEAAFLTVFAGFGRSLSSRITLPVVLFIPAFYYMVQLVYYSGFGSLISVSMAGMGGTAMGDFGWAIMGTIVRSIPLLILILLPVIIAAVLSITDCFKLGGYIWQYHIVVLFMSVILWIVGILGIRMFGTERPAPYYLFTSSQATTDAAARKLGVITTGVVESGSYFMGIGRDAGAGFIYDDEDMSADSGIAIEYLDEVPADSAEGADSDATSSYANGEEEKIVKTPWINEGLDFDRIAAEATDDKTRELARFLSKRKPSETNEYTGLFEGYNLIYICAESFWNYACNEDVTPTLYKMANNGIVLNNYYNSFYNTTTNGEFAFCTSLWPDVSRHSSAGTDIGSFAQSATKYMPQGMGNLFTAQNIPAYAYHNYYGKYYRRILSWPNLGYKCRFTGDGMWFTSNWPASDLELMEQSVDEYINENQFHVYYMTFSGHGPFTDSNYMFRKNIGDVTKIPGTEKYNDEARGYLAGELELDRAMEYLLNRLEEAGKLDNTVIVIAGDHYPYYLTDEGRVSLVGYDIDRDFDIYKSTCIIYNAGLETPVEVDTYCDNVDIAPTMLNLFNIPFDSRMMMGRDIFSDEARDRAVLYNMSFVSDYVRYNYETAEAEWTDEGNKLSDAEKDKYLRSVLNELENEYNASCMMIEDNFFLKAYNICGLMSDDEVKAEEARALKVKSQDETYNAEDEAEEAQKELEKQQEEAAAALLMQQQTPDGTQTAPAETAPAE